MAETNAVIVVRKTYRRIRLLLSQWLPQLRRDYIGGLRASHIITNTASKTARFPIQLFRRKHIQRNSLRDLLAASKSERARLGFV